MKAFAAEGVDNTDIDRRDLLSMRDGDEAAFAKIYQALSLPALRYAAAMVGGDSLCADAVQETFVRVFRNRSKFDANKPFEPWFYRILINECRRALRWRKRLDPVENLPHAHAPQGNAELYRCIRELPANLREPLVLRYLMGYRDREVADLLGISLTAVKGRVKRAREQLRGALE